MKQSYTRWLGSAAVALAMSLYTPAYAQKVVFPQKEQAGEAAVMVSSDTYVLKNNLLTATFKKQGQSLVFGGCPQLNLEEGSELFELQLDEGGKTLVKASELELKEVEKKTYTANEKQVKGSRKLPGKAIEAKFVYKDLNITWRAVLRDGSHYLRTELELSAPNKDVRMFAIRPMLYQVNVAQAGSAPKVVGNTRGAVLLSDKIFAGVETPTGINSVGGGEQHVFAHSAWNASSFSWKPTELPEGIKKLDLKLEQLVGTKGYLSFKEGGDQTITFTYLRGAHKLNIAGVELRDVTTGRVVASDYHYGRAGGNHVANVYHLNVPARGVYEVRYFISLYDKSENKPESIESQGKIVYSKAVAEPALVYDLAPDAAPVVVTTSQASGASTPSNAPKLQDGSRIAIPYSPSTWREMQQSEIPSRIGELGYGAPNVQVLEQSYNITTLGELQAEFVYVSGTKRLNIAGFDLVDANGQVVVSDYHVGFSGTQKEKHIYKFTVPNTGEFKLRYFVQKKTEENNSSGSINLSLTQRDTVHFAATKILPIQGTWSRNTTLQKDKTWKIGAVVGLVAPGQPRRSFLSYSERERAVPWRTMPAYISWYELNIDRNNDRNYTNNMNIDQCVDVVQQWKKNLFDRYGERVNSFVWDDGWDFYGTWDFNKNFPNGLKETDALVKEMGSGQGAWLGPVGGYGDSGNYRRAYWENQGKMQLSNPKYYKVFTDAIKSLCHGRGYDFRFFKFDGISAQFSSVGPDAGTVGEENAEGIISAEMDVRENIKEDIFFNTTVGTWASPMWFHVTDAIWRQENDYGEVGNQGTDREKWITYRDRLVYQNFVQNSPLCPINTLMTHGFILSKWGKVSKNMDYDGIVRELRCAFACGSGMVELYNDYALMNSINGGRLWGDLAECLRWQRVNADVLPDAHWVGGNPWTGTRAEVYGWAAWNGDRSVFTLRNPAHSPQTYKTTLRTALEIPEYFKGKIILSKAFGTQANLPGVPEDTPIDIDDKLTIQLPGSSVYVFNGRDSKIAAVPVESVSFRHEGIEVVEGKQKTLVWDIAPVNATHTSVEWKSSAEDIVTVQNGVVKGIKPGTATITVTAQGGKTAQVEVRVLEYVPEDYAISFEKDALPTKNDRFVRSVSITEAGKTKQTRTISDARHKPWQDLTAEPIEVTSGAILTPHIDYTGVWMHGYVYLDMNQNKQFDVKAATDEEVMSFSYFDNKKKELGRISTSTNRNPGFASLPRFKAPTTPGTYRLRFKVDWDSIDPAGNPGPSNEILSNRGSVTDVLLKVVAPSSVERISTTTTAQPTYDLGGRQTSATIPGVYIVGQQKVVK